MKLRVRTKRTTLTVGRKNETFHIMKLPLFDLGVLEAVSDVLGHTSQGLTGTQIGKLLDESGIADALPSTKRHRLYEALKNQQEADGAGNRVVLFIENAMNPVRYHYNPDWFESHRAELNHILAFAGMTLGADGKMRQVKHAKTHLQAQARATNLRENLLVRNVHPDVLVYCKEELLADNYFHAVFEATKSVAEKIRQKTGLDSDGSRLVDEAFGLKSGVPNLAINSLESESLRSEQTGFMNLLKGLFGTFRNVTAHTPKITWQINEQDALDILTLVSLIHRRLDTAVSARRVVDENNPSI